MQWAELNSLIIMSNLKPHVFYNDFGPNLCPAPSEPGSSDTLNVFSKGR